MARVLVLCPTFDHADTLYASIASVRAQEFSDWEMVVIGDGAPPRSEQIVAAIAAQDGRIKTRWHPKAERFGEIYRDAAIRESGAEYVCHLSDDDIWAPDHLVQMTALLERADWANQAPLRLSAAGDAEWWPINHGTPAVRASVARHLPVSAGINYVAYRRSAYLALPEGWTCAPMSAGTSDVFMWAKFFRNPALAVASSSVTSALKFPSHVGPRIGRRPEERMAEISPWLARAAQPGAVAAVRKAASVRARMIALFRTHCAGKCATSEEALARSGFIPASAEAEPVPALNGEPMILPLTQRQRDEVDQAWAFVRDQT